MIAMGSPTLTQERIDLLASGTVMALLDSDHVAQLWFGTGPGADYLAVESRAEDGSRFMFSRVRLIVDDKLWGSDDLKHTTQVACGPDVPDEDWDHAKSIVNSFVREEYGVEVQGPVQVDGGFERLTRVMQDTLTKAGWQVSFLKIDDENKDRQ